MAGQDLPPGSNEGFGLPVRDAANDANAGILNKQYTEKQFGELHTEGNTHGTPDPTGEDRNNLHIALTSLAEPIGRAMEGYQKGWDEELALETQARQGFKLGIDEVARSRKRGDWLEALAGQDVSYRTAQLQAIRNNLDAVQVEDLSLADKYAADTPEEFLKRKQDLLPKYLEPFKDDLEAQSMIRDQYSKNTKTLAKEHMKNHTAFVAQQVNDEHRKGFLIKADEWNERVQGANGDWENLNEIKDEITDKLLWTPDKQISKQGHYSALSDAIEISLADGNLGLYRASLKNKVLDEMPHKERIRVIEAVGRFEKEINSDYKNNVDQIKLLAESGDWQGVQQAAAMQAIELSKKNTGTGTVDRLKSRLNLTINGLQVQKTKNEFNEGMEDLKNGSFADLMKGGEGGKHGAGTALASTATGSGNSNAFKVAATNIDEKTVGEVEALQKRHIIAAAGYPQITPGTMEASKHGLFEITSDMQYNEGTQTKQAINLLWARAGEYLSESDEGKAARKFAGAVDGVSSEWGIFHGMNGSGKLDGINGNKSKLDSKQHLVQMRKDYLEHVPEMGAANAMMHAFTGSIPVADQRELYERTGKNYDNLSDLQKLRWGTAVGKEYAQGIKAQANDTKQTLEQARDTQKNLYTVQKYNDWYDNAQKLPIKDRVEALNLLNSEAVFDPRTPDADRLAMMEEALKNVDVGGKAKEKQAKILEKQQEVSDFADTRQAAITGGAKERSDLGQVRLLATNETKEQGEILASIRGINSIAKRTMGNGLEEYVDGNLNISGAISQLGDPVTGVAWVKQDFSKKGKNPLVEEFVKGFLENPGNQVIPGKENELTQEAAGTWKVLEEMSKYPDKLDDNLSGNMRIKLDIYQTGLRQGKSMDEINKDWAAYNAPGRADQPLEITNTITGKKETGLDAAFSILDSHSKEYGEQNQFKHMIINDTSIQQEFLRQYQIASHMGRSPKDSAGYALGALTRNTTLLNGHVIYTNELSNIKLPNGGSMDLETALNGSETFRREMQQLVKGKTEGKDIQFNKVSIREATWDEGALTLVIGGSNGEYSTKVLSMNDIQNIAKETHSDILSKAYAKRMEKKGGTANAIRQMWGKLND